MIRRFELFCPTVKRRVKILVSIPKDFKKAGITYDTLYILDGQNAYKDYEASFGKSLNMGRYLAIMAERFGKRICGVAIENAGSDLGRINEYTPFPLERFASNNWKKQNVEVCRAFTYDLIHSIVPYIQKHFPVSLEASSTFIFGSSLGALYANYVAHMYPNVFGVVGSFSNCPFLVDNAYYKMLESNLNKDGKFFNYVGAKEESDGDFDQELYFRSALRYHKFLKDHGIKSRLLIDYNGIHNEKTWESHVMQFLSYIYFDDIEMSY